MKIPSSNNKSYISIEFFDDGTDDYISYVLEIVSDIEHSFFKGSNSDIHFLNMPEFIDQLDSFVLNRNVRPKLEGTYDSYLSFIGSGNVVEVNYCIGSQNDHQIFSQKGGFEISQEHLSSILTDLKTLYKSRFR